VYNLLLIIPEYINYINLGARSNINKKIAIDPSQIKF